MKHVLIGFLAIIFVATIALYGFMKLEESKTRAGQGPMTTKVLDKLESEGAIDFEAQDINGKTIKLSQFKGKAIILSFWASWCDPCVEEFPSMLKLINKFKGEIVMVAVSADYNMKDIKKFLKVFKAKSPHLYVVWDEDKSIASKYSIQALPESFVFKPDFMLSRKISGSEDWATEDAFDYFSKMLLIQ